MLCLRCFIARATQKYGKRAGSCLGLTANSAQPHDYQRPWIVVELNEMKPNTLWEYPQGVGRGLSPQGGGHVCKLLKQQQPCTKADKSATNTHGRPRPECRRLRGAGIRGQARSNNFIPLHLRMHIKEGGPVD